MNKKTVRYIIIFILILAVAGFWYFQRNSFSKEIMKLEILGPETTEVGQKVDYVLKYKNNGDITLINAKLSFEFPENSLTEDNKIRIEQNLEDIYPGEEKTITLSGRILGQENELKKAQAWLSFQPKNLKARYEVSTTQTTVIKFSPLTFEFDLPSKIEAEKDFSFSLNYFSNVDYPLSQLRVKIEYPAGFEFVDSTPKALEKDEWQVPILNKADGGRIKIFGRINGNIGEQKMFRASFGMWQDGNFILLKEASRGAEIIRPTIYLSQLVNGASDYVASSGDTLHYEIFFRNIGSSPFENLFLVVNLEGSLFDLTSLQSPNANYHQGNSSMIWDWKKNPQLRFLDEDEEGKVEFWIALKKEVATVGPRDKNLILKNSVNLSPAKEEFSLKVNSKLDLDQQVFFNSDLFQASGSLPLRVGQPTALTVTWKLKNFYNDLRNTKVKATLPSWVSLTGQLLPRNSSFVFDSQSREIIWDLGEIKAGQGANGTDSPSLSFQILLTPNSSQLGQTPGIINRAQAFGDDTWTQEPIESEIKTASSGSLSDPGFDYSQGIVQ
ncbi:hypothetical protein L6250_00080 [Candidatus Parcubacteria bacterium]|nr:hypothetical protein [Patescibacteria group bacterium]MBU4466700.1 hypothetical protein [Patescibacteria group bacterium]MCG2688031.1 hypothetical protein [Candidatus Parcubacteria bacterium]